MNRIRSRHLEGIYQVRLGADLMRSRALRWWRSGLALAVVVGGSRGGACSQPRADPRQRRIWVPGAAHVHLLHGRRQRRRRGSPQYFRWGERPGSRLLALGAVDPPGRVCGRDGLDQAGDAGRDQSVHPPPRDCHGDPRPPRLLHADDASLPPQRPVGERHPLYFGPAQDRRMGASIRRSLRLISARSRICSSSRSQSCSGGCCSSTWAARAGGGEVPHSRPQPSHAVAWVGSLRDVGWNQRTGGHTDGLLGGGRGRGARVVGAARRDGAGRQLGAGVVCESERVGRFERGLVSGG